MTIPYADCAANWRLDRMAVVDRNVLRLGVSRVVEEAIGAAGALLQRIHGILNEAGGGGIPRVDRLTGLEEDVGVLGAATQHRVVRVDIFRPAAQMAIERQHAGMLARAVVVKLARCAASFAQPVAGLRVLGHLGTTSQIAFGKAEAFQPASRE